MTVQAMAYGSSGGNVRTEPTLGFTFMKKMNDFSGSSFGGDLNIKLSYLLDPVSAFMKLGTGLHKDRPPSDSGLSSALATSFRFGLGLGYSFGDVGIGAGYDFLRAYAVKDLPAYLGSGFFGDVTLLVSSDIIVGLEAAYIQFKTLGGGTFSGKRVGLAGTLFFGFRI